MHAQWLLLWVLLWLFFGVSAGVLWLFHGCSTDILWMLFVYSRPWAVSRLAAAVTGTVKHSGMHTSYTRKLEFAGRVRDWKACVRVSDARARGRHAAPVRLAVREVRFV